MASHKKNRILDDYKNYTDCNILSKFSGCRRCWSRLHIIVLCGRDSACFSCPKIIQILRFYKCILYNNNYFINAMDAIQSEEESIQSKHILFCRCLLDAASSKNIVVPERKKKILSAVARTEAYLRERRIPELIRFLITKVISHGSDHPIAFMERLIDDCMLFRAGHGQAPVLYEERHLKAVVQSFDPGNRGWMNSGQVCRAFTTLGLTPPEQIEDKIPTDIVLQKLCDTQELELLQLLLAGNETMSSDDSVP